MTAHSPLPIPRAAAAVARCFVMTAVLLLRGRVHLPRENVGLRVCFADGTSARVFRETVITRPAPSDPCVLVVTFTLRGIHGRGHALFRRESLLNTMLFAGFPGLLTKLWLTDDDKGRYRGLYEWDGPASAEAYARALWRVLALVSVPGSIDYQILPGLRRGDLLATDGLPDTPAASPDWWWPTEFTSAPAAR